MAYDCERCGRLHWEPSPKHALQLAAEYFRKRAVKFEWLASFLPDEPCQLSPKIEALLSELAVMACGPDCGWQEDKWRDYSPELALRQAMALKKK